MGKMSKLQKIANISLLWSIASSVITFVLLLTYGDVYRYQLTTGYLSWETISIEEAVFAYMHIGSLLAITASLVLYIIILILDKDDYQPVTIVIAIVYFLLIVMIGGGSIMQLFTGHITLLDPKLHYDLLERYTWLAASDICLLLIGVLIGAIYLLTKTKEISKTPITKIDELRGIL